MFQGYRDGEMDMEKSTNKEITIKPQRKSIRKRRKRFKKWLWILFFTAAAAIFCAIIVYGFIIVNGNKLLKENIDIGKLESTRGIDYL